MVIIKQTSTSTSRLLLISVLLMVGMAVSAQSRMVETVAKDSTRLFKGIAVSVDVVGAAQMHLSSY